MTTLEGIGVAASLYTFVGLLNIAFQPPWQINTAISSVVQLNRDEGLSVKRWVIATDIFLDLLFKWPMYFLPSAKQLGPDDMDGMA